MLASRSPFLERPRGPSVSLAARVRARADRAAPFTGATRHDGEKTVVSERSVPRRQARTGAEVFEKPSGDGATHIPGGCGLFSPSDLWGARAPHRLPPDRASLSAGASLLRRRRRSARRVDHHSTRRNVYTLWRVISARHFLVVATTGHPVRRRGRARVSSRAAAGTRRREVGGWVARSY